MPWARFEAGYPNHPKVASLSDRAFRLHVALVCFCVEYLTDSRVAGDDLEAVYVRSCGRKRGRYGFARAVQELVDARLLDRTSHGVTVHDFLDYNPTKEKVLRDRAAAADRKKRSRGKGGHAVTDAVTSKPGHAVTEHVGHGGSHAGPSPPLPSHRDDDDAAGGSTNGKPRPVGCGNCVTFGHRVGWNAAASKPCTCPLGVWRVGHWQQHGVWPVGPERPVSSATTGQKPGQEPIYTDADRAELGRVLDEIDGSNPNFDAEVPL